MTTTPNVPTVVLVHGGFADASFWTPVVQDLQARGIPVLAPPNPLRGLASDAAYIASFVKQVDGPVLLVGHSYGGAVITVAGASADNVVGSSTSRRSSSTRASRSARSSPRSRRRRSARRCGPASTRWPTAARPSS
jgi:pimeloyl-ACP methyl ester carboxylesterase